MLAKEEGAKYLVVAWVKDWSMRTLAHVIAQLPIDSQITQEGIDELAKQFPFMPTHLHWYVANKGKGILCRKFVAEAFPRLSERLWDTDDNAKRLTLAAQIVKLKAGGIKAQSTLSYEDRKEVKAAKASEEMQTSAYHMSREAFKTHRRGAWNVCK